MPDLVHTEKHRYAREDRRAFIVQAYDRFSKNVPDKRSSQHMADCIYHKYVGEGPLYKKDVVFDKVLKYLQEAVVPHKLAVYAAGYDLLDRYDLGEDEKDAYRYNLWQHDFSKFCYTEAMGYAFHDWKSKEEDPAYELAWLHHKHNNPHHPEYWLDVSKYGVVTPRPMGEIYILEMFADWIGAGESYDTPTEEWMEKNLSNFIFGNPEKVKEMLEECFEVKVEVDKRSLQLI